MKREVEVFPDLAAAAQRAAEEFVRAAREAAGGGKTFDVALSGGSTPRGLYERLARPPLVYEAPWRSVRFFWGDERLVPSDHADSNFRLAKELLLDKLPVPPAGVYRVHTETPDAAAAAEAYDRGIRHAFSLPPGAVPRFDLMVQGLGGDGHTASLFPGTSAVAETRKLAVAVYVEKLDSWRVTLTLPVLNNAAEVLFLAAGAGKASTVAHVLGDAPPPRPAQLVRPANGRVLWLLDRAAASLLPR